MSIYIYLFTYLFREGFFLERNKVWINYWSVRDEGKERSDKRTRVSRNAHYCRGRFHVENELLIPGWRQPPPSDRSRRARACESLQLPFCDTFR